jgi:preprotein translocase SecE subunit
MEKQATRKIITLSFLAAALIAYVVVNVLFKSFAGAFGVVQKLYSIEIVSHGLPILTAVVVFAVLQFNKGILEWAEDVVVEVSKVVWPSRKDTVSMTIVVCVFVGFSSLVLIAIDTGAHELVKLIIH